MLSQSWRTCSESRAMLDHITGVISSRDVNSDNLLYLLKGIKLISEECTLRAITETRLKETVEWSRHKGSTMSARSFECIEKQLMVRYLHRDKMPSDDAAYIKRAQLTARAVRLHLEGKYMSAIRAVLDAGGANDAVVRTIQNLIPTDPSVLQFLQSKESGYTGRAFSFDLDC